MYLKMECKRCLVAKHCPKSGMSPQRLSNGIDVYCRLVGGYGRTPVDEKILSEESKAKAKEHGPCLTIAEIPDVVGKDFIFRVEKVFHPPVKHARETTTNMAHLINDKNMKVDK